jgi:hypothetical protein
MRAVTMYLGFVISAAQAMAQLTVLQAPVPASVGQYVGYDTVHHIGVYLTAPRGGDHPSRRSDLVHGVVEHLPILGWHGNEFLRCD